MSNINLENKSMLGFAREYLLSTATFPYMLLRDYQQLGIDEKALVVLLRILRPLFNNGSLTLAAIAAEFSVTEDEAKVILMPFLDKRLLEKRRDHSYSCDGIIRIFYEKWIAGEREKKNKRKNNISYIGIAPEDQDLIRNLTRLFHAFEQEMGKPLTPIQSEEIRSWLEEDKMAPEMIEEALKRAVLQEKRTFSYIKSILKRWRDAGYHDLPTVLAKDHKEVSKPAPAKAAVGGKGSQYNKIYEKY